MGNSDQHRQVVRQLLESKAVDFNALGKVIAEVGPSLSLAEDPGDFFCGTNRIFFHVYQIFGPNTPVENLGELGASAEELH
jgi:hypothetical protein